MKHLFTCLVAISALIFHMAVFADKATTGQPEISTFKTIAFGPKDVLFVGDNDNNYLYAIHIDDKVQAESKVFPIQDVNGKIAAAMGTNHAGIWLEDMAINPRTNTIFIAASRMVNGKNISALFRVGANGLEEFPLNNVEYTRVKVSNPPPSSRNFGRNPAHYFTFTDMHYVNGEVLVSGLSNEEFSSSMRRVAYPFKSEVLTTGLQVYHVSHGSNETHAPVSRFSPVKFGDKWHIVAGYACTPLVTINVEDLNGRDKLVGRTVAEIGAGNSPTGIINYNYKGTDYVLVGNNRHSLVKFTSDDLAKASTLTRPSRQRGVKRESTSMGSIVQLTDYDSEHVAMVIKRNTGNAFDLQLVAKASI